MKVKTTTTVEIMADDKKVAPLEFVEFAKIMFEEELKNGYEIVKAERDFMGRPSVTLRKEEEAKVPSAQPEPSA